MNGAPDWQDGECCFRCRTQFTLVARKHHCRNCGNIFCAKCSSQQIPLPKLNIEKPVRVCDGCHEKISNKNEDPLTLALDKTSDSTQAKTSSQTNVNSKSGPGSGSLSSTKSTSSNKSAANASAPSEQELKEEEELQLALALSLSEAPVKISFPDFKQFEEPIPSSTAATTTTVTNSITTASVIPTANANNIESNQQRASINSHVTPAQQNITTQANSLTPEHIYIGPGSEFNSIQTQVSADYQVQSRDQDLFRFVNEVQSVSEVFTNRVNSNKLRNRPVADDSAIQALFLKLTNMHTKLLEYIKTHDEERAGHELVQDKLSQISDARAALDALREEHQEKLRQEAAEAERQRQSQLALKLEMMRQKKSQMMQYQREMALQRIQQQEMMLRQPQAYQTPPVTSSSVPQQVLPQSHQFQQQPAAPPPPPQQQQLQQLQQLQHQQQPPPPPPPQPPITTTVPFMPQHQLPQPPPAPIQHQQQMLPMPDDEAPLISFDD